MSNPRGLESILRSLHQKGILTLPGDRYVPLSVRHAPRISRTRFDWQMGTYRERTALKLAPWLNHRKAAEYRKPKR